MKGAEKQAEETDEGHRKAGQQNEREEQQRNE